ncbi:DNA topoisomerase IV [Capnocytophaga sp. ARDL2]|uniref:DNA topoisomerase IV n=1 Tax=Capnocytophaga sp. ARDL2 TaxID=3238809 RepID=UPI003557794D
MKYLGLTIIMFSMVSCFQPQRNCKDYETGIFVFEQEIDGKKHQTVFTRTEEYQIETYQGKTDTAKVRWINDCEFVLERINPKNRTEEKPIHIKILTTDENSYTFEYNLVGNNQKQRGVAKKQ